MLIECVACQIRLREDLATVWDERAADTVISLATFLRSGIIPFIFIKTDVKSMQFFRVSALGQGHYGVLRRARLPPELAARLLQG